MAELGWRPIVLQVLRGWPRQQTDETREVQAVAALESQRRRQTSGAAKHWQMLILVGGQLKTQTNKIAGRFYDPKIHSFIW